MKKVFYFTFLLCLSCSKGASHSEANPPQEYIKDPNTRESGPDFREEAASVCSNNMLISRYSDFDPNQYFTLEALNLARRRGGGGGGGGSSRGGNGGSSDGGGSGYSSSTDKGSSSDGGSSSTGSDDGGGSTNRNGGGSSSSGSGGGSSSTGSGSSSSSGGDSNTNYSEPSFVDSELTDQAISTNLSQKNFQPLVQDKRFMLRRAYIHRGHPGSSDSQNAIFDGRNITDVWIRHGVGTRWDPQGYWIICYQENNKNAFLIYRSQDGKYKIYKI